MEDGYLMHSGEDYLRFVMGKKNYERALKDMNIKNEPTIVRMADGTSKKFKDFNEVRAFYEMMHRTNKDSMIHPDERNLSSVLKEKA
jgi:3-oxoacyl-(acyl-carrier-protein) synthase